MKKSEKFKLLRSFHSYSLTINDSSGGERFQKKSGIKKPVMGRHRFFYCYKKEERMRRKEQVRSFHSYSLNS
ncbi:MAG: hypothetical protein AB1461_04720 [Thermodesulfobacteriota bacterium]